MLTERQHEVLDTIRTYHDRTGYAPSIRELADLLGISGAATYRALVRLRDAGAVDWDEGVARTLRVLEGTTDG